MHVEALREWGVKLCPTASKGQKAKRRKSIEDIKSNKLEKVLNNAKLWKDGVMP